MKPTPLHYFWDSPAFRTIAPYIRLTPAADTARSRNRIELMSSAPWLITQRALEFHAECVRCEKPINVFRMRKQARDAMSRNAIYVAATCPLHVNVGCARGPEARTAYACIATVVRACQQPSDGDQGTLFMKEAPPPQAPERRERRRLKMGKEA